MMGLIYEELKNKFEHDNSFTIELYADGARILIKIHRKYFRICETEKQISLYDTKDQDNELMTTDHIKGVKWIVDMFIRRIIQYYHLEEQSLRKRLLRVANIQNSLDAGRTRK